MAKDYDIAKKSVQDEILEAVGSVAQQEDVQEILEKVAKVPISIGTANNSASSTTEVVICNISGEGVAVIGGGGVFTIVVDGVTVVSKKSLTFNSNTYYFNSLTINFKNSLKVNLSHPSGSSGSSRCGVSWQLF